MKSALILILIFLPLFQTVSGNLSSSYDVAQLRGLYRQASEDSKAGELFCQVMQAYDGKDPVVLAYKAAAEAIEAKYATMVVSKLRHLKASAKLFEQAVEINASNAEIRFLRYTVESNVPRYLKMSQHLSEDKKIVMSCLRNATGSGLAASWVQTVCDIMISLGCCSEEELTELRQYRNMFVAGVH